MKRLLFLLTILSLTFSCGLTKKNNSEKFEKSFFVNQVIRNGVSIDSAFIKYVEVFEKHYGEKIGIGIKFNNLEEGKLAVCYYSPLFLFPPFIEVDFSEWGNQIPEEREATILHELGHCVLGRDHLNDYSHGEPKSLMYFSSFNIEIYKRKREKYIKELFNLNKKPMIW